MGPDSAAIHEALRKLPKIDLHRHLLGSARPETLWELCQKYGLTCRFPSRKSFTAAIVHRDPVRSLREYITPWTIFRELIRTPDEIRRVAVEAVVDAGLDGITYVEFRTSLTGMGIRDGQLPQADIP